MAQEEVIITAQKRTVKGKQVKALRRAGILPGVIYGRHLEAFPIQMAAHEASLKLGKLTSSSLVTIDVEGEKHTVIVRDRQRDPIYGRLIHVDFLAVSLTETLRTTVEVVLVGEAPVSKLADVVILHNLYELEIECLPKDLPAKIEVDLSLLTSNSATKSMS
jgi:large subunit ribosomal protein L25